MIKAYLRKACMGLVIVTSSTIYASDITVGFGFSINSDAKVSIGVRIFDSSEDKNFSPIAGLEWNIQEEMLAPTLGIAYLGESYYLAAELAYNGNSFLDFSGKEPEYRYQGALGYFDNDD